MSTAVPAEDFRPLPARVVAARRETADTVTLDLALPAGMARPRPGQFNMLYAFGAGEVPISVSAGCEGDGPVSHTLRAVGAVTRALAAAEAGAVIGMRGPFGRPWPLEAALGGDMVLVAGGIGLAPLRPLVHAALADRAGFGRVVLLCGARGPGDLVYAGELARWQADGAVEVGVTVDRGAPGWTGRIGFVTALLPAESFDPARTAAFVCGPEVMMRHVAAGLVDRGVDPARLHVSMERSMKCAVGSCGHCQFGPHFVCRDGPVFAYQRVAPLLGIREV